MIKRKKLRLVKAKRIAEFSNDGYGHAFCMYCKQDINIKYGHGIHSHKCICLSDFSRVAYAFTKEQVDNTYYRIRKYADSETKEFEYIVTKQNRTEFESWDEALAEIDRYIINQEKYAELMGFALSDLIRNRNSLDGWMAEFDGSIYQVEEFVKKG